MVVEPDSLGKLVFRPTTPVLPLFACQLNSPLLLILLFDPILIPFSSSRFVSFSHPFFAPSRSPILF